MVKLARLSIALLNKTHTNAQGAYECCDMATCSKISLVLVTSMVCLNGHGCIATNHRGQEYRGGAMQGAMLDKQAFHMGCHQIRTYTMIPRCSVKGTLRRKCSSASTNDKTATQSDVNLPPQNIGEITGKARKTQRRDTQQDSHECTMNI